MMEISFVLNGRQRRENVDPSDKADAFLRRIGVLSLRNGCNGEGACGACTIVLNGRTVSSCLLRAVQLDGKEVCTVEYYSKHRQLDAIQSAMVDAGVVQCGYCTPAMVLAIEKLLDRHPQPTKEQVRDALSGIFCRCTGYEQFYKAVQIAAQRRQDPNFSCEYAPAYVDEHRFVGKPGRKIDSAQLARGENAYVEDFIPADACVMKMMRSPHASAYIKSIDTSEALKVPGVVYIMTHENCPEIYYNQAGQGYPEPSPYDRMMIGHKVNHVGDRVAAIVAETWEAACEAEKKIKVEYEVLPHVLTVDEAMAPGAPVVHNGYVEYVCGAPDDLEEYNKGVDPREGKVIYQFPLHGDAHRNKASAAHGSTGDIEKGFAEADEVIERVYETTQIQCTPVEPHVVFCKMQGDRLIIHASTQVPYHLRRIVASLIQAPENKIRVIKERVGGGFGVKQDIVLEEVVAYLTWITGRPIYQRFTREEEFIASRTRHLAKMYVKIGGKKDGTITAVYMDVKANTGPYGAHCLTVPMNACSKTLPLLDVENMEFDVTTYYTNIAPAGAYQGYGAPKGSFALQLAIAELADKLGVDHMEMIEKNRIRTGSVMNILKSLGEGREGQAEVVGSCGLGEALARGRELMDWGQKEESDDPEWKIGKGFAIVMQGSGLPNLDSANAEVRMISDGTFIVLYGGADLGTGLDTVACKLVAEELQIDPNLVTVWSGDTDATPFDVGAYASSGTFFSGGAVHNAAKNMKKRILEVAAQLMEVPAEELHLEFPGKVVGGGKEMTYWQIAHEAESGVGVGQLMAYGHFIVNRASVPYGAHFAKVKVSTRTGEVKVIKYCCLEDCGTPINPELTLGQMYGGVLKTIGHSLYEQMIYDENGRCLNPNFTDYKVPMIGDAPDEFISEPVVTNDDQGPMGAKSVSEITCNGASPCIAEAIHDAVGVWIRDWPFSAEKVLKAMGKLPK